MCGILVVYLVFGSANDFACNLIGLVYPAYVSWVQFSYEVFRRHIKQTNTSQLMFFSDD